MQAIIENNRSKIIEVSKQHHVKKLYAFGSVCTGQFNENSDIDFLVTFEDIPINGYAENYFNLEEKLSKILDRQVDVVVEHTLSNPYFIKVLNKTKTSIYE